MAAAAAPAFAMLQTMEVKDPRRFGYWTGDVVTREVHVAMAPPYTLERKSLPRPGRLDRWLWLRGLEVEAGGAGEGNAYRLRFSYQILTAPAAPQRLFIPQQTIYFAGDGQRVPVIVEALGLTVSPLTAPSAASQAGFPDLQPAVAPPPLDTTRHAWWLGLAGVCLLSAAVLLLYVYGSVPWLRRSHGPFHRALAVLRPLARERTTQDAVARAWRSLHHAFNATAGEVLLSADLVHFFDRFPAFRGQRDGIEEFYRQSRRWFYGGEPPASPPADQLRQALDLCRACRDIERGLA